MVEWGWGVWGGTGRRDKEGAEVGDEQGAVDEVGGQFGVVRVRDGLAGVRR